LILAQVPIGFANDRGRRGGSRCIELGAGATLLATEPASVLSNVDSRRCRFSC